MTDITPLFNGFLKAHEAAPVRKPTFNLDSLDDFLKQAYTLNSQIASLHASLLRIRQSYLSTAPPRRNLLKAAHSSQPQPLTTREREEIDANAKQRLREFNAGIQVLSNVENVRREAEATLIAKKYGRALGSLASWAAGGGAEGKTTEHRHAEEKANAISGHREAVLWLLKQRLQECVRTQQNMMEARLSREMERNLSVLAKARGQDPQVMGVLTGDLGGASRGKKRESTQLPPDSSAASGLPAGHDGFDPSSGLTDEQIQMFEKDNQDMLKHYESTLDQVRNAQESLVEISQLQTQLVSNLEVQSSHIDQLVTDSYNTTENIGGGNRQLKKASERKSTAKWVFYATCTLCSTLIIWDLIW